MGALFRSPAAHPPTPAAAAAHPLTLCRPQTGVKGVLADHAAYQRHVWSEQERDAEAARATRTRGAFTTSTVREDEANEALAERLREGASLRELEHELTDDVEAGGGDDDAFLREYRAKRLLELRAQQVAAAARQRRVFGRLYDIDEDAYQDILEEVAGDVSTVVHIGDEQLVACRRLNAKLRVLAER